MTRTFTVHTVVWLYPGKAGWHFVSIDPNTTKEINSFFEQAKRGWGSLRVEVTIGKTTWDTSIFPDNKTGSYLLPIKKDVRTKENIKENDSVDIQLEIHD